MKKYHSTTFDNISDEKQQRIIKAAITEFASCGFMGANINHVAANASVSVGSMYQYFDSKESLFLTLVDMGYQYLNNKLMPIIAGNGDVFEKIEQILIQARDFSRNEPEVIQIYLDSSTERMSGLGSELSKKIESISANYYRSLVTAARSNGLIDVEVDDGIIAFFLDSLFVMMQFSYASSYYQSRMHIFLGAKTASDDDAVLNGMMTLIRSALKKR